MKIRVFTLRFDPAQGGFDDGELRAFMDGHDVIDVEREFFKHQRTPWMMLMVRYEPAQVPREKSWRPPAASGEADEAAGLDPVQRGRYESLRSWRNARARSEGIPTYGILHNNQLAELAKLEPQTLADLAKVKGIGERKRAKYGDDLVSECPKPDRAQRGRSRRARWQYSLPTKPECPEPDRAQRGRSRRARWQYSLPTKPECPEPDRAQRGRSRRARWQHSLPTKTRMP